MRAAFAAALLGLSLSLALPGSAVRAGELALEGNFVQGVALPFASGLQGQN